MTQWQVPGKLPSMESKGRILGIKTFIEVVRNCSVVLWPYSLWHLHRLRKVLIFQIKSGHPVNHFDSYCWASAHTFPAHALHICTGTMQTPQPSHKGRLLHPPVRKQFHPQVLGAFLLHLKRSGQRPGFLYANTKYSGGNEKFMENFLLRKLENFLTSAADFCLQT